MPAAARARYDHIFHVSEMHAVISNSGESIFRLLLVISDRAPTSRKEESPGQVSVHSFTSERRDVQTPAATHMQGWWSRFIATSRRIAITCNLIREEMKVTGHVVAEVGI